MMVRFTLLLLLLAGSLPARHVVLVSIDGFAAYHLQNPKLELPNIRELIADGAWAASSETIFPSVTHPSHTTIVTGVQPRKHGVLSNWMTNRKTGEAFHPTNKPHADVVKVRTLFDAAKAAGLSTAAFYWPETKDDPAVDYNIPEVFTPRKRADVGAVAPEFLDELRRAGVPIDLFYRWYGTPRRSAGDVILTEAAAYVIRKHQPNLLAIHLVATDAAQHQYGPEHYLSQAALTMADYCVGILRKAVADAGIEADTTFVIAADHGFHSVYKERNIRPVFARAGLLDKVRLHGHGWMIELELGEKFDPDVDGPTLEAVFKQLRAGGMVRNVIRPEDMHKLGRPRYEENDYVLGQYILIPDIDTHLVVDPNSDSTEPRKKRKPYHGHGYLPQHPRMYPSLVLSGAGIRRGARIGHTSNLNIAPTIATLLGVDLGEVDGQVLRDVLDQ